MRYRFKTVTLLLLFIYQLNLHATINGIQLEIVEASQYGTVHIPLVNKRLDITTNMFQLGYMQAGKSTTRLLNDNSYYVITLKDKYSKAPLHIITNGAYMKKRPYNAGVLTEVSFILSKDLLGPNYNKKALDNRLNTIAKKVIKRKGFVLDNKSTIDYTDILLYKNGTHVVYKPYDPDILTLEKMIKENKLSYQEAHHFVYDKREKRVVKHNSKKKKVKTLYRLIVFKHIPNNMSLGTEITILKPLRVGSAPVDGFEILGDSMPFRIDNQGKVTLARALTQTRYSFNAVAHTKDGDSNIIEFNIIIDPVKEKKFYKVPE